VALAAMLGLPEPIAALNRLGDTVAGLVLIGAFLALLPEASTAMSTSDLCSAVRIGRDFSRLAGSRDTTKPACARCR
jgi:hypothetical protein